MGWRGGCLALGLVRGAVRHYCLGGCRALVVCARRSRPVLGGSGPVPGFVSSPFPPPAPRFLRCVWRAVPSGCPISSLAGTPFHAVCAFRGLGPVALLVFRGCPLCVCALALLRRLRPPSPSPDWCGARTSLSPGAGRWQGRSTRSVPLRVSCLCPVLRLACLGGGAARSRFPLPGLGLRAPRCIGTGGCVRVCCVWVRACCELRKQNVEGIEMYYKICCFYFDCLCTDEPDEIM